jgi:AAA+ superfamily predicted ATPase
MTMFKSTNRSESARTCALLAGHFQGITLAELVTSSRTFPVTSRVDLQTALTRLFEKSYQGKLVGFHAAYSHETITFSHLIRDGDHAVVVAPLQYDEIDFGDIAPARCLKRGLWLSESDGIPFAVLVTHAERFGCDEGMYVEIAVPAGEKGVGHTRAFMDELERVVSQIGSYRGKVISLEAIRSFSGKAGTVRVQKLRDVRREEVILPEKTLSLLERNVTDFIRHREDLKRLGMSAKKGLLFYGPPGTGKTHTIQYLASQLRDHTTLLITAEQVALLEQYFQLARFLQPAMFVIEDVDLIARAREDMRNPCEESLLNKLLNEMDGLREDASVLFVLTTNRPDQLEAALASRPGRIDQAIEFPLPDDDGRRKLVQLYARGLILGEDLINTVVQKTKNASAAFIKELMRRSAQYQIQAGSASLAIENIESALEEMLFAGGSLNVKILGGAAE